ncbi:heavy-metal-associated domain-containing protein [Candidatus Micrarchaeota archaeon]|nr:heavy-metal-associated domain-containing protein [Candidatus Micrarchaeota archaeon]
MRKELSVEGMHCASCGLLIKQDVSRLKGVNSVEADFKSGRVSVDFDGSSETLGQVVSTIKKLGYKLR